MIPMNLCNRTWNEPNEIGWMTATYEDVHFGGISVFTQIKLIAVTRSRKQVVAAVGTHEIVVGVNGRWCHWRCSRICSRCCGPSTCSSRICSWCCGYWTCSSRICSWCFGSWFCMFSWFFGSLIYGWSWCFGSWICRWSWFCRCCRMLVWKAIPMVIPNVSSLVL